jgi:hypothetical protein
MHKLLCVRKNSIMSMRIENMPEIYYRIINFWHVFVECAEPDNAISYSRASVATLLGTSEGNNPILLVKIDMQVEIGVSSICGVESSLA